MIKSLALLSIILYVNHAWTAGGSCTSMLNCAMEVDRPSQLVCTYPAEAMDTPIWSKNGAFIEVKYNSTVNMTRLLSSCPLVHKKRYSFGLIEQCLAEKLQSSTGFNINCYTQEEKRPHFVLQNQCLLNIQLCYNTIMQLETCKNQSIRNKCNLSKSVLFK